VCLYACVCVCVCIYIYIYIYIYICALWLRISSRFPRRSPVSCLSDLQKFLHLRNSKKLASQVLFYIS
jgi:hypothetical protein